MRRGAVLAFLVAMLAAASASGAGWVTPTRLATTGETSAGQPAVAVNPDGSGVAAWGAQQPDGKYAIRVAQRAAGGPFGDPVDAVIATAYFQHVVVATNPHGDVLLAWDGGDGSGVSVRSQGAAFSAPALATPGDGYVPALPQARIDNAGRGTTVWRESTTLTDSSCDLIHVRAYARARVYNVHHCRHPDPAADVVGSSDGCIIDGGAALDQSRPRRQWARRRGRRRLRGLQESLVHALARNRSIRWRSAARPPTSCPLGRDRRHRALRSLGYVEDVEAATSIGVAGLGRAARSRERGAQRGPVVVAASATGDAAVGFADNPSGLNHVPSLRPVAAGGTPGPPTHRWRRSTRRRTMARRF